MPALQPDVEHATDVLYARWSNLRTIPDLSLMCGAAVREHHATTSTSIPSILSTMGTITIPDPGIGDWRWPVEIYWFDKWKIKLENIDVARPHVGSSSYR